ncbi:hypothetical protein BJ165DRAFT_1535485 [Panaeolus papilionaceus]|nr:hypothetical protein BJ165DRAFT_1535485 [Panaeolus papilionaceus]
MPDHAFLRELRPSTRKAWSLLCKAALEQVAAFENKTLNIMEFLAFFFKGTDNRGWRYTAEITATCFRDTLSTTSAVVVGSLAREFIDRAAIAPDTEMELMVPDAGIPTFELWILSHEFSKLPGSSIEYTNKKNKKPPGPRHTWSPRDKAFGVTLYGIYRHATSNREIFLFVAKNAPFASTLHGPLTHMYNCFDYEAAYCPFPHTTFEERISIITRPSGLVPGITVGNILPGGWTVSSRVPEKSAADKTSEWWEGTRWLGDAKTMMLVLRPHYGHRFLGLLRANSWSIRYSYRHGLKPYMYYETPTFSGLANSYTVSDWDIMDDAGDLFNLIPPIPRETWEMAGISGEDENFRKYIQRRCAKLLEEETLPE